jgi:hypothetical protein
MSRWTDLQYGPMRDSLVQELIGLWDSDIGDLDIPDFDRIQYLERELGMCSFHPQHEREDNEN